MLYLLSFLVWFFVLSIIKFQKIGQNLVFQIPFLVALSLPVLLMTGHNKVAEAAAVIFFLILLESVLYRLIYED